MITPERQIARQRLSDFEKHPRFGQAMPLARLAAVPVVITPDLLHLLRINFLSHLPYTVEADLLLSPLCSQVGDDLYEIERHMRDMLLEDLRTKAATGDTLLREIATLLWNYTQAFAPWITHTGLERAQELTALNVLDASASDVWLSQTEDSAAKGSDLGVAREWFVAMRREKQHTDAAIVPKISGVTIRQFPNRAVNIRTSPSRDAPMLLDALIETDTASVINKTFDVEGQLWIQVALALLNETGWILAASVEVIGDLTSVPTVTEAIVTTKGQVYISYPNEMREQIRELRPVLERDGWTTWMDEDVAPGSDWVDIFDQEIRNSAVMLVAVNARISESIFITEEWATALALGKRVLPIRFETPRSLHPRLAQLTTFDARSSPLPALLDMLNNAETRPAPQRLPPQRHVYIAYDSDDLRFVRELQSQLERAEIPVKFRDTRASADRIDVADEALRSACAVLVIVSPRSADSVNCTYEWATALALDTPVIPILLEETEMHPKLKRIYWSDFTGDTSSDVPWNRLIKRVREYQPQQTSAADLVAQGLELYQRGEYADAEALFERATQTDPDNEDAAYWYATSRLRFGDIDNAQRKLEDATQIHPDSMRMQALLGRVYFQRASAAALSADRQAAEEFFLLAEAQLEPALSDTPGLLDENGQSWWETLGTVYQRQGKTRDAIDAYQQAENYAQPTTAATLALAELYAAAGQIEDMRAQFRALEPLLNERIDNMPTDYYELVDLLVAQASNGNIEAALSTLDRLTALLSAANAGDTLIDNLLYSFHHWQPYFDESANRILAEAIQRLEGMKSGEASQQAAASPAPPSLASRVYTFATYKPNTWQPLTVVLYAYRSESEQEVEAAVNSLQAVARYRNNANAGHSDVKMTFAPAEGTTLIVTPSAPGIEFSPPSLSLAYHGDIEAFDFRFRVQQVTKMVELVEARLEISADGATLMQHRVRLNPGAGADEDAGREESSTSVTDSVSPYQSVFACYSREDTAIVERVRRSYQALGLNFIADVGLRSENNSPEEIERVIASADIFQLFWSRSAAASPIVEREWRYALKLIEDGSKPANFNFIRPVYWEEPLPPIPSELRHLHFTYEPDLGIPPTEGEPPVA